MFCAKCIAPPRHAPFSCFFVVFISTRNRPVSALYPVSYAQNQNRTLYKLLPPGYLDHYGKGKARKNVDGVSPGHARAAAGLTEVCGEGAAPLAAATPRISSRWHLSEEQVDEDLAMLKASVDVPTFKKCLVCDFSC